MKFIASILLLLGVTMAGSSCSDAMATEDTKASEKDRASRIQSNRKASKESKTYWYDGTAEITSYKLSQARYGELREGTAVLLYVTEPFSKSSNAKADVKREDNVPVIKLNAMKKFTTGVYPYSLMTSTFFPFEGAQNSLKASFSMQEWCGITYSEMRNKGGQLTFDLNSYFEGESFKNKSVSSDLMEDDIWTLLRLNPKDLPSGEVQMIPSMSYLNLKHVPVKAYQADVFVAINRDNTSSYHISYPELKRKLEIRFETDFPHAVVKWKETYRDGAKELTTTAELIKQIKSDYWNRSSNTDGSMRDELGLD